MFCPADFLRCSTSRSVLPSTVIRADRLPCRRCPSGAGCWAGARGTMRCCCWAPTCTASAAGTCARRSHHPQLSAWKGSKSTIVAGLLPFWREPCVASRPSTSSKWSLEVVL